MSRRCKRCSLPNDGAVCGHYERRNHVKCAQGDGDRSLQWKCAHCHAPATCLQNYPDNSDSLLTVISTLSEKFELVNKIQLPKLNGELAHIKHVSERIAKQNTEILRKLSEAENRGKKFVDSGGYRKRNVQLPTLGECSRGYRKRNVQLPTLVDWAHKRIKACTSFDYNDHQPMMPERTVRYKVRRKAYMSPLVLMVQALNRRLRRTYTYRPRVRRR